MHLDGEDAFMSGQLEDHEMPQAELDESVKVMEGLPTPSDSKTGKL